MDYEVVERLSTSGGTKFSAASKVRKGMPPSRPGADHRRMNCKVVERLSTSGGTKFSAASKVRKGACPRSCHKEGSLTNLFCRG
jgi:hypothetical protein